MPWPEWLTWQSPDETRKKNNKSTTTSWNESLNATDWTQYTSPRTLIPTAILTFSTLALIRIYRRHLRRVPQAQYITPPWFHKRSLYGYVSSVGDGDNFRLYHTPGGRLAGWGWFPGRRVQHWKRDRWKDNTVHVRIAGVDAPELAHFGRPAQPYGSEALDFLRSLVLNRYVRVYVYRRDQYERVVASAYVWKWGFWKTDVGHEMLKNGLATVYEAKFGSEFGNKEELYRKAEENAKRKGYGLWKGSNGSFLSRTLIGKTKEEVETPRQYKDRISEMEKGQAGTKK